MEFRKMEPSMRGRTENFTGDVWLDVVAEGEEPSRLRANVVRFAPGARSAWHSHPAGQTLFITAGVGLVQARGGDVVEVRAGDIVESPPDEWHWHGAAPEHFMTHLALWEAPSVQAEAEIDWGEHVTDSEYNPEG